MMQAELLTMRELLPYAMMMFFRTPWISEEEKSKISM
jgi:hypothetical protein